MVSRPLRVAVVGIGGFAGAHHKALRELEQAGRVKVVAACDPRVDTLHERCVLYAFKERGIEIHRDLDSLLLASGESLDLVDVVSPIRFHAEHHRACVERGLACYLEKPPTLDPRELERMIATEATARRATQVGFNHIGQAWRQRLKKRVLAGEFGRLSRVTFKGLWRRSLSYYERNEWAGRLLLDGGILLDSCCGNAMAHHVHNLLFHAGADGVMSWAEPATVDAELYRVNAIESADTIFARGVLRNGVEFRLVSTHACEDFYHHVEILECERARIEIPEQGWGVIFHESGRMEQVEIGEESPDALMRRNLEDYCDYLTGRSPRPATLLSDTRPFVHFIAMLFLAARRIEQIHPPHALCIKMVGEPRETLYIRDIRKVCDAFVESGHLPSNLALPWAAPGGVAHLPDLERTNLLEVLKTMSAQ
ncbi:MAG TPA: Gfo/Idh/MocA family oxidoreductase [Opitutaceae bacterium]|nr:Gfo/Idh/MocA family oxidoreductase [Opitutaceae bacterium]